MNDFITKDSGKRATFSTGMQRDLSEDKPRFDLLIPLCLPIKEQLLYKLFKDDELEQLVVYFLSWFLWWSSSEFLKEILDNPNNWNGIEQLALLLKRWAVKYEERNREKAETKEELNRFKESAARHFFQYCFWLNKEENHLQATIFNIIWADMVNFKLNKTNEAN